MIIMDYLQTVISISILAITAMLVVTGVWFTLLLKDLRSVIKKTTSILDDANSITASIARPVSSFSDFVMGFRNGVTVFNKFFDKE
jgi:hypothetical protein